jgi:hypothetical protein
MMTIEDGTHSGSRNVVGKLILHTVQNSKTENQYDDQLPNSKVSQRNNEFSVVTNKNPTCGNLQQRTRINCI